MRDAASIPLPRPENYVAHLSVGNRVSKPVREILERTAALRCAGLEEDEDIAIGDADATDAQIRLHI